MGNLTFSKCSWRGITDFDTIIIGTFGPWRWIKWWWLQYLTVDVLKQRSQKLPCKTWWPDGWYNALHDGCKWRSGVSVRCWIRIPVPSCQWSVVWLWTKYLHNLLVSFPVGVISDIQLSKALGEMRSKTCWTGLWGNHIIRIHHLYVTKQFSKSCKSPKWGSRELKFIPNSKGHLSPFTVSSLLYSISVHGNPGK